MSKELTASVDKVHLLFEELLKKGNNLYTYREKYINYFNYVEEIGLTEDDVVDHFCECYNIIKYQSGTCRAHEPKEGRYETIIMKHIKTVLTQFINIKHKEYAQMLSDIKNTKYVCTFDPSLHIYYAPLYDASIDETIIQRNSKEHFQMILSNLTNIYKLQELNSVVSINKNKNDKNMARTSALLKYYYCMCGLY